MTLFTSIGKLRYGYTNLVLDVDDEIVRYYRSLLSRTALTNPQKYNAHISVVRKETPKMEFWKKYEGELIEFQYTHVIRNGTVYYWIDAWCKRLEEIRTELGLVNESLFITPPDGFLKTFHISLGNQKNNSLLSNVD